MTDEDLVEIVVDGTTYLGRPTPRFRLRKPFVRRDLRRIAAQFPGAILAVHITPGEEVVRGQAVLVLEAMKMQNTIVAPVAGRVKAVPVAAGSLVSKGDLLVELE